MIDTDKYGDMTMKDITAPIDEETCESPQIPARWKVKLCWTGAYTVVDDSEVICSLTGNKDSANRKEWAELIADAPLLLAEVKRLREMLYIAEQNIPRRIHWDCYVNALIEAGFEEGEEE